MGAEPGLIPHEKLKVTSDGRWARLGNRFVPLPETLTPTQRALFQQGGRHVPLDNIPEFFQR